jgi:hypothetical protein
VNVGKVAISNNVILGWLQLEGGTIRSADYNYETDVIELIIEHPEMPEHVPSKYVEIVTLDFVTYQDNVGNKVNIRQPIKGVNDA